jgi:hypothetical protein
VLDSAVTAIALPVFIMPNFILEFGLPLQRLLKMIRAEKFASLDLISRRVHR